MLTRRDKQEQNHGRCFKSIQHVTLLRLLMSPRYTTQLILGDHSLNSRCQVAIVDSGTTRRNGPYSWCWLARTERNAIVCIVFPRPISSARITLFSLQRASYSDNCDKQWFDSNYQLFTVTSGVYNNNNNKGRKLSFLKTLNNLMQAEWSTISSRQLFAGC